MKVQIDKFEEIYNHTYNRTLKFIVIKCNNIEDINDIIQDTYLELLNKMKRNKLEKVENIDNYILGIATNVIKRHYTKKKKENIISYDDEDNITELLIQDNFDLEESIITKYNNVTTRKSFPKSKKIYIRIFNLGYTMYEMENDKPKMNNAEDFSMSKYIWNFEIGVPEKFYERETVELKPESEIPGIEVQKITVTESGMVLRFKSEEYNKMIFEGKDIPSEEFSRNKDEMLNISDETGKVYKVAIGGTTGEENTYSFHIDINKKDLDKKFYINFKSNGVVYSRELLIK